MPNVGYLRLMLPSVENAAMQVANSTANKSESEAVKKAQVRNLDLLWSFTGQALDAVNKIVEGELQEVPVTLPVSPDQSVDDIDPFDYSARFIQIAEFVIRTLATNMTNRASGPVERGNFLDWARGGTGVVELAKMQRGLQAKFNQVYNPHKPAPWPTPGGVPAYALEIIEELKDTNYRIDDVFTALTGINDQLSSISRRLD